MVHESEHGISNPSFYRPVLFLLAGAEILSRYVRDVGVQQVQGEGLVRLSQKVDPVLEVLRLFCYYSDRINRLSDL